MRRTTALPMKRTVSARVSYSTWSAEPSICSPGVSLDWQIFDFGRTRAAARQAAALRAGRITLFDEELGLLGDVAGRDLVHLQCNAGQDTLSLAQRGARVTGIDLAGEPLKVAQLHLLESGLEVEYRLIAPEALALEAPHEFDDACIGHIVGADLALNHPEAGF